MKPEVISKKNKRVANRRYLSIKCSTKHRIFPFFPLKNQINTNPYCP